MTVDLSRGGRELDRYLGIRSEAGNGIISIDLSTIKLSEVEALLFIQKGELPERIKSQLLGEKSLATDDN